MHGLIGDILGCSNGTLFKNLLSFFAKQSESHFVSHVVGNTKPMCGFVLSLGELGRGVKVVHSFVKLK